LRYREDFAARRRREIPQPKDAMTTKYRPSTLTAVLELMLVLAVGLIVVGVVRGWFAQAGRARSQPSLDGSQPTGKPADRATGWRQSPSADRIGDFQTATPSIVSTAAQLIGGNSDAWAAHTPRAEEARE
jgi:hypothetical protein